MTHSTHNGRDTIPNKQDALIIPITVRDEAMPSAEATEATKRRLALYDQGYEPIPTCGKYPTTGWNAPDWVAKEILRKGGIGDWPTRFRWEMSTAVRIINRLGAIDLDINDKALIEKVLETIKRIAPDVWQRAPIRGGSGTRKLALFPRIAGEEFIRVGSHKYYRPGDDPKNYHHVEIFGGKLNNQGNCSRLFALFGPRKFNRDETGMTHRALVESGVKSTYQWDASRPTLDEIALTDLPTLTKRQAEAICTAFDIIMMNAGWIRIEGSYEGSGEGDDIFDIDREHTRFDVWHGESGVTYDELENLYHTEPEVRVSPEFIDNEVTERHDRCRVYWSRRFDCAYIKDFKTNARHYPKEFAPIDEVTFGSRFKQWWETYGGGIPLPDPVEVNDAVPPAAKLEVFNAGKDVDPPTPREWLLGNTFCREFLSELFGDGAVGKSALRYAQMLALASGRPITGEHIFQRCRVLVVCLEDSRKELRRRILAARKHHGIKLEELDGWLFYVTPKGKDGKLMTLDSKGKTLRGALAGALEEIIKAYAIDLVMIDPFVKAHSVEENANSAIDDVVQVLTDLTEKYNIAADCTHHTSKGSPDPGNADRGRGATALKDAGRLIYTINKMSTQEAERFGLPEKERKQYVRVDNAKVNLLKDAEDATWYRLVSVALGNSTAIYKNGDHVQTVEPWMPPPLWRGVSEEAFNDILAEIDKGLPDGDRYTSGTRTTARSAWPVVADLANKTEKQARAIIDDMIERVSCASNRTRTRTAKRSTD
jgi:hypothetical protein